MHNPVRPPEFPCAARQGQRNIESSLCRPASSVFWRGAAIFLLGVTLLGAASIVREFDISIRERRVEGSAATIRVKRGETVVLRWRTDEAVSLHVHGYDLRAYLSSASTTSMRFEAGVAGRFAITAHDFGTVTDQDVRPKKHREISLLYLEVLPE